MPPNALVILDDGDKNLVKDVGARLAEAVVGLPPAGHKPDLAGEGDVCGREADGDDVVLVEDRPVQVEQGHVESVWLCQHVSAIKRHVGVCLVISLLSQVYENEL